ncbi:hypothetical protein N7481_007738 [Penicillium waksmanii]|uniref:uncharacterized protein n=1 Tax=Penicillium waksmanii TaxID=69791 RepID=UPI002548D9FA|nr:uncharacterized protein N7481_007738 [Penicillium waksmanii]KAJ5980440.1 hypothetical protein N7481_007738 [Penicillium waksmanii]
MTTIYTVIRQAIPKPHAGPFHLHLHHFVKIPTRQPSIARPRTQTQTQTRTYTLLRPGIPPPPDPNMSRIVVTGGSGKAGQYVINELLAAGHQILNLDLMPMTHPDVHTLKTDLSDSGQVFNALSGQWTLHEPFPEGLPPRPDAVVHLAGYARNMIAPDNELFRANTQGTYNLVEAACKLGIRKIIIASSVTVYGVSFAQGDANYPYFPIDEDQDVNPTDTYALAKLCNERVARGFAARFGVDIYILRIGRVIEPEDYNGEIFYSYVHEPEQWKVHGWSYIDARDLGGHV